MTLIIPPGKLANAISVARSLGSGALSLALGPWGKLIGIGILVGGGLLWFRLWLNKHDDRIFQQGKDRAVETMTADYDNRLKISLAEAKAISDTVATDRKAIEAQFDDLKGTFGTIFTTLRQIKVIAQERQVIYVKEAAAVPANKLDDALRAVSNDPAIKPVK